MSQQAHMIEDRSTGLHWKSRQGCFLLLPAYLIVLTMHDRSTVCGCSNTYGRGLGISIDFGDDRPGAKH